MQAKITKDIIESEISIIYRQPNFLSICCSSHAYFKGIKSCIVRRVMIILFKRESWL